LMRFLSRRWFWRAWVVQELAYARSKIIWCGSLRLGDRKESFFTEELRSVQPEGKSTYRRRVDSR
jgi:hypothetical protein